VDATHQFTSIAPLVYVLKAKYLEKNVDKLKAQHHLADRESTHPTIAG